MRPRCIELLEVKAVMWLTFPILVEVTASTVRDPVTGEQTLMLMQVSAGTGYGCVVVGYYAARYVAIRRKMEKGWEVRKGNGRGQKMITQLLIKICSAECAGPCTSLFCAPWGLSPSTAAGADVSPRFAPIGSVAF